MLSNTDHKFGDIGPEQAEVSSGEERPHAQHKLLSSVDKCKICKEPAAKHIHYGAVSCFSCRAFFRRSIQNETSETYVCRRNKDCQINIKTRRNCQYCRYRRCLDVGMKPSWVLSPDERERRFKKSKDKKNSKPVELINCKKESNPMEEEQPMLLGSSESEYKNPSMPILQLGPTAAAVVTVMQAAAVDNSPSESTAVALLQQPQATSSSTYLGQAPFSLASAVSVSQPTTKPAAVAAAVGIQKVPKVECSSPLAFPTVKQEPIATYMISMAPNGSRSPSSQPQSQFLVANEPKNSGPGKENSRNQICISGVGGRGVIVQRENLQVPPVSLIRLGSSDGQMLYHQANKPFATMNQGVPRVTTNNQTLYQLNQAGRGDIYQRNPNMSTPGSPDSKERMAETALDQEEDSDFESDKRMCVVDDGAFRRGMMIEPDIKFSSEEYEMLTAMVEAHDKQYKSVNFGEQLIKEMIMCSMFKIPISGSAALNGYRLTVERVQRIANSLDMFQDLDLMDQHSLLKENADLLVSLRGAIFFDSRKKGVNQVLMSLGIDDIQTIKRLFANLMKDEKLGHINYTTFNSIQQVNNNNTTEQRYNYLQGKIAEAMTDDIIVTLLTYIVLFSSDFCELSDKAKVESTQAHFTKVLRRYIYSKSEDHIACVKFAAALKSVTFIREMADIKKKRYMKKADIKLN